MCRTVWFEQIYIYIPRELKNQCGEDSFLIEAYTSRALSIQGDAKLVNRVTKFKNLIRLKHIASIFYYTIACFESSLCSVVGSFTHLESTPL